MADLVLIPTERKEKIVRARVEMIGGLLDRAEQLAKAPVLDVKEIKAIAEEMDKIGLHQSARSLRKLIGE